MWIKKGMVTFMELKQEHFLEINRIIKRRELGIYIHIPFCVKKCDYCDFLSAPSNEDTMHRYVEALINQIYSYRGKTNEYIVPSIFIGGGTPSIIEASDIQKIMNALKETFLIDLEHLEATIEVNPGTVSRDKLIVYKNTGINRLSFGLQSTDDKELKLLGRIHNYNQFLENYLLARKIGFDNINIDLMSALPGQTLTSWEKSLRQILELDPEHISAYSLIVEEGTPFFDRYGIGKEGAKMLPDEDTDRQMYHMTQQLLKSNGYHRYEISNYAKEGYECRHNSSYWIGTEYLGIGLGASSLIQGYETNRSLNRLTSQRFRIIDDLEQYIQLCMDGQRKQKIHFSKNDNKIEFQNRMEKDSLGLYSEHVFLTEKQRMEEFMFLGLRLCKGVQKKIFKERFNINIETIYGEVLDKAVCNKLLLVDEDNIRLTELGIDLSNVLLSEFLLDV